MKKLLNTAYWLVLVFYVYLLIETVFFARDVRRSVNLVPFDMIREQGFTLNVWGNVLMFIPLGVYLANSMKSFHFWKILGTIIGTSLGIEVLQYVFMRGSSDIDDLLLNTIGGLMGLLIYSLLNTVFKLKNQVHTAISVLSLIVGLPVFIISVLLVVYN